MVPAVRVVILNYNGGAHVLRCVEAVTRLDWPADRLDVVVVDNASSDRSASRIAARFPDVRVLHHAVNTGFSANNLAMSDLDDVAYVALVNPDAFVEPGWLAPLVDALESDSSLGAACPKMLLEPTFVDLAIEAPEHRVPPDTRDFGVRISGLVVADVERLPEVNLVDGVWGAESDASCPRFHWTSGSATIGVPLPSPETVPDSVDIRIDSPEPKRVRIGGAELCVGTEPEWHRVPLGGEPYDVINNAGSILVEGGWGADRGLGQPDGPSFAEPRDVFAWCGGGVLLRSTYLRDVGLFDESFFLYYEDTDLSWRGQGLGWRYRYVPEARMRHLHGASTVVGSPLFVYNVERNRLVMLLKNAPGGFVLRALLGYIRNTGGLAKQQVLWPIRNRRRPDLTTTVLRIRAFAGVFRAMPATLRKRRAIRARMRVDDASILAWQVPQP